MISSTRRPDMRLKIYPCPRCGAGLRIEFESRGNTGVERGRCNVCLAALAPAQFEGIRTDTDLGKEPIIPILVAAGMLGAARRCKLGDAGLGNAVFSYRGTEYVGVRGGRSGRSRIGMALWFIRSQPVQSGKQLPYVDRYENGWSSRRGGHRLHICYCGAADLDRTRGNSRRAGQDHDCPERSAWRQSAELG